MKYVSHTTKNKVAVFSSWQLGWKCCRACPVQCRVTGLSFWNVTRVNFLTAQPFTYGNFCWTFMTDEHVKLKLEKEAFWCKCPGCFASLYLSAKAGRQNCLRQAVLMCEGSPSFSIFPSQHAFWIEDNQDKTTNLDTVENLPMQSVSVFWSWNNTDTSPVAGVVGLQSGGPLFKSSARYFSWLIVDRPSGVWLGVYYQIWDCTFFVSVPTEKWGLSLSLILRFFEAVTFLQGTLLKYIMNICWNSGI